jgi:hypothetical protein
MPTRTVRRMGDAPLIDGVGGDALPGHPTDLDPVLAPLISYLRAERIYADFTIELVGTGATVTPAITEQIKTLYSDRERARKRYDEAVRSSRRLAPRRQAGNRRISVV